jgi:hypothetical protein
MLPLLLRMSNSTGAVLRVILHLDALVLIRTTPAVDKAGTPSRDPRFESPGSPSGRTPAAPCRVGRLAGRWIHCMLRWRFTAQLHTS